MFSNLVAVETTETDEEIVKLNDFEVLETSDKKEAMKLLEHWKETDKWHTVYGHEVCYKGFGNNPFEQRQACQNLTFDDGKRLMPVDSKVEEDAAVECTQQTGIFLILPNAESNRFEMYATGDTAIDSILRSAGDTGNVMRRTVDNRLINALGAQVRAERLTEDMKLQASEQRNMRKILVRDGKVRYMGSSIYAPLCLIDGVNALEEQIIKDHPDAEMANAKISHEYALIDYRLNDSIADGAISCMLEKHGIDSVHSHVRFSSSDVGQSMMRATVFIDADGVTIPMAYPVEISHDKGHEIKDFTKAVSMLGQALKDNEDRIEVLGNTPIKHVAGCFYRLTEKLQVPASFRKKKTEELQALDLADGTAIDVYIAVSEMVTDYLNSRETTPTLDIAMFEAVGQLLRYDFTAFDKVVALDN